MPQLFPVKVKQIHPSPFQSADASYYATGDDGMDYMVKEGKIAVSEFLCYKIFQACGVAVPEYSLLEMPNGDISFGSRIVVDSSLMSLKPLEKFAFLSATKNIINSICGLDLFIWNEDRHIGNFLFFKGMAGDVKCQAMDFSRAFIANSWPTKLVWTYRNNTSQMHFYLKSTGHWDNAYSMGAINSISQINQQTWISWIDELPEKWIEPELKIEMQNWWLSTEFMQHQQECLTQAYYA